MIMAEKEKLEEQIGEVLGLEMAAQKAVEDLSAKGLLEKGGLKSKLQSMKKEAGDHQTRIEQVMQELAESEGLDQQSIRHHANETSQKASQMMQIYLGEDPETLDARVPMFGGRGRSYTLRSLGPTSQGSKR